MCQDLPLGCLHCLLVCAVQDRNFGCSARFYIFYWNVKRFWNFLHCLYIKNVYFSYCFWIFGVPEVWWMFILLQTVLFKTYSVFDALFACFDETIDFYRWYKPWKSYITVDTMQKQNMNWFATVLRVVICFIILTDLTELSVEFCVDEVIKDRGGFDMRRRRRGKSSILGMPKAPQVSP